MGYTERIFRPLVSELWLKGNGPFSTKVRAVLGITLNT